MKCSKCNNETEFRKTGKMYLSGKMVYQRYQCLNCYAMIKGEQIKEEVI